MRGNLLLNLLFLMISVGLHCDYPSNQVSDYLVSLRYSRKPNALEIECLFLRPCIEHVVSVDVILAQERYNSWLRFVGQTLYSFCIVLSVCSNISRFIVISCSKFLLTLSLSSVIDCSPCYNSSKFNCTLIPSN